MNLNVCSDPCHVVDPVCMFSIHYVKQECCLSDPGSLNFKICLEQSLMGHLSVHTGALFSSSSYIHLSHLHVHSFICSLILPSFLSHSYSHSCSSIEPFIHSFIIPLTYKTTYTFIHHSFILSPSSYWSSWTIRNSSLGTIFFTYLVRGGGA